MEVHQPQHCSESFTPGAAAEGDGQRRMDTSELHPSVRFYRGLWSLTQLTDPVFDDVVLSADSSSSNKAVSASASTTPAEESSGRPSPLSRGSALSVVGLHQTLLPPAAMNGIGDVADESYAVQIASSDGLEFLRLHWHILLPLLFPCCLFGDEAGVTDDPTVSCSGRDSSSGKCSVHAQQRFSVSEEGVASPAESSCSASELYELLLRRTLLESDLAIVREPGVMDRVYYSYVVLLRFFGWRVHEEERGVLDRHRAWQERYQLLELYRTSTTVAAATQLTTSTTAGLCSHGDGDGVKDSGAEVRRARPPPPPTYSSFNFYESGVPHVLRSLLDIGFLRLAVRLVEFLLEEMGNGRLVFLLPLIEETLLPILAQHPHIESSHKTRLKKRLYRLTHSDSD
ncbi:hypothetical protein, conserved [Leishmania tarentolae]|uniref:Uncharacterized protein n=1 Tax=Leishmania tarentolae TaxID=5689 RepID=A0A640KJN9_LEITA|nr:hypothetical protein, conserved [Leishmania tarentolae]